MSNGYGPLYGSPSKGPGQMAFQTCGAAGCFWGSRLDFEAAAPGNAHLVTTSCRSSCECTRTHAQFVFLGPTGCRERVFSVSEKMLRVCRGGFLCKEASWILFRTAAWATSRNRDFSAELNMSCTCRLRKIKSPAVQQSTQRILDPTARHDIFTTLLEVSRWHPASGPASGKGVLDPATRYKTVMCTYFMKGACTRGGAARALEACCMRLRCADALSFEVRNVCCEADRS